MPTFFSSHILCCTCRSELGHVHVLCMYMYVYRVNFIWCEAMLLVVNILTCPIGTDCGGSAPVVGVYRQPRLAEGVLPTGNYIL